MMYKAIRAFLLTAFSVLILVPCSIVIMGAFKSDLKIISEPLALPDSWNFSNFKRLLETGSILTPTRNSLIVSISLAIPGQVNLIPIYLLFVKLHLTNSLIGLVLVNIALTLPISIFIMTAFFKDLPKEMFEVAGIDGAGPWRIFRSIALPLSRPAIGATGIFLFVICWNDLLYPLMLITQADKKTLPLTLIDFRGEYLTQYSMIFTAIIVASLPMIIMYIAFQRSFIAGLTQGAVKG
ncbi:MAG: carbohydrate ABC transporter permease [Actinobacteria bacterium]|nr:carbohydrate ABC transporter permease [Actinomycetota bacterium]